jgi:C4-dicarboxylate-specific signal transduction histidine kinase
MAWSQLLHNSILAIGYKGTIRLRAVTADGCTQVSIEDSGPGFSKEAQERIFEPFFTTRPKGEGLGLGLYVTQHLVQQAGGTLSITSSAEGAVATITLNRA